MATNAQILSEARASLLRILQTDTESWSEGARQQHQIRIRELRGIIDDFESRVANDGTRQIISPVRRVNI